MELAKLRAQKLSPERRKQIADMGASLGGQARAENLSAKRRKEIARKAAAARWGNRKKTTGGTIIGVRTEAESSPSKDLRHKSWEEY